MTTTLDDLRRFTVARNFFQPTTLKRALQRMGFVQADPIRAPARAQDLILRHRVKDYHAGDLERFYEKLDIEEDFFVNYGYVTRALQRLMHPRSNSRVPADDVGQPWPAAQQRRAKQVLEFVRDRGIVHPREVDEYFSHGKVKNYWGGSSNATTHLLDAMHYRGMLRVVRREKGIRIYASHEHESVLGNKQDRGRRMDELVDAVVSIYAPLPAASLAFYVRRLRFAVPQWRGEVNSALLRAKKRLEQQNVNGVEWYWGANERKSLNLPVDESVRLLAPFDPVVHDRARFELLWGWTYRLEAYTPAQKRKMGYYAMPLLWGDKMIGWSNISVKNGRLEAELGSVKSIPQDRNFKRALAAELTRMKDFLRIE